MIRNVKLDACATGICRYCGKWIQEHSDDGYSGTNFERPAFKQLLDEIEAGNVDTIIVKDMSRFGRDSWQ